MFVHDWVKNLSILEVLREPNPVLQLLQLLRGWLLRGWVLEPSPVLQLIQYYSCLQLLRG